MPAIGLVAYTQRPDAVDLAARTAGWLDGLGHEARRLELGGDPDASGLDLVVSLGGDGTMLRTVRLAGPLGIPVLGVNFGHLGYLTAVEPDGLEEALRRFLTSDYEVESRMTMDVTVREDGAAAPVLHRSALNDVIVQRLPRDHVVRVAIEVNGRNFVSYAADSVLVATPTGSTGYNLSARGPIVSPPVRVQIVTPVAPHSLFDRSVVFAAEDRIVLRPDSDTAAELVIDGGACGTIKAGQTVECTAGARDALLVTFGGRDFEDILKRKFKLGGD